MKIHDQAALRIRPEDVPAAGVPGLSLLVRALEHVLGLRALERRYERIHAEHGTDLDLDDFVSAVLDQFEIDCELPATDLERVPATGGLLIVANHPFGAIEGLLLCALLRQVRPDVRFMANHLLGRLPELRDMLLEVDPFGSDGARKTNSRPLRDSIRWLEKGGALVVFPSGEVASRQRGQRGVVEAPWSTTIARIQSRTGVPVLPIHIAGKNSELFHLAGLVHPVLRTLLLARQLLNKQGSTIKVRMGNAIPPRQLERFEDDHELVDYLRLRTLILDRRITGPSSESKSNVRRFLPWRSRRRLAPIIPPVDPALLAEDIASLPADAKLTEGGGLEVWHGYAPQIPHVLREIGRLREETFRVVGEGTGREIDLDRWDSHYLHLFLWDPAQRAVIGAYRLGQTDKILFGHGADGLYTSSLYRYDQRFLDRVTPGLELGRAFVSTARQRGYAPLFQLWRGICAFVHRFPRYRLLFGPVSISGEHNALAKKLMIDHLVAHSYDHDVAAWVKPVRRVSGRQRRAARLLSWTSGMLGSLDAVSAMVSELETDDRKGVPVLLREYLKFGGRLVAFNEDPDFNYAIDGLVIVDLVHTDPRRLSRYMGKDQVAEFLAHHQPDSSTPTA